MQLIPITLAAVRVLLNVAVMRPAAAHQVVLLELLHQLHSMRFKPATTAPQAQQAM
jgi:hypothetical protein